MSLRKYILKRCSTEEYLTEEHTFTDKLEGALRLTAKEAQRENCLLQLDHVMTWIHDAEILERVDKEQLKECRDLVYNKIDR